MGEREQFRELTQSLAVLPPILERELLVAARRRSTYWWRGGAAASALFVWVTMWLTSSANSMPPAVVGKQIFSFLGAVGVLVCLLAGVFLTADCVSQEKREGTLGLLFLTELRGYDVVLGKLAASSLRAGYCLLGAMPVLALPLLMGGVTIGEFARVILLFGLTLATSLAVGLVISTVVQQALAGATATLGVLLILAGVLPALHGLAAINPSLSRLDLPIWWSSPFVGFAQSFDQAYRVRTGAWQYWGCAGILLALTSAGLLGACLGLRRGWIEGAGRQASRWAAAWRRIRFPDSGAAAARERRRLSGDPTAWQASRDRLPSLLAAGLASGLVLLWLGFYLNASAAIWAYAVAFHVPYALHLLIKLHAGVAAASRFFHQRQDGIFEQVLGTRVEPGRLLAAHLRALRCQFLGPSVQLLLVNGALVTLVNAETQWNPPSSFRTLLLQIVCGGALLLALDLSALCWVGAWVGLRARRQHRAVLGTLGRVMGPGWIALFLTLFASAHRGVSEDTVAAFLRWWIAVWVFWDLILIVYARRRLREQFRELATAPR